MVDFKRLVKKICWWLYMFFSFLKSGSVVVEISIGVDIVYVMRVLFMLKLVVIGCNVMVKIVNGNFVVIIFNMMM